MRLAASVATAAAIEAALKSCSETSSVGSMPSAPFAPPRTGRTDVVAICRRRRQKGFAKNGTKSLERVRRILVPSPTAPLRVVVPAAAELAVACQSVVGAALVPAFVGSRFMIQHWDDSQ